MSLAHTGRSGTGAYAGRAQSDPPTVTLSAVAVDKTQIEVNGKKWLYAVIESNSKVLLEVSLYRR